MPNEAQKFVVVDPRTYDGNAYEVAERAVEQVLGLVRLVELSLGPAEIMSRNAHMERQMSFGEEPDAGAWPESPQGRHFAASLAEVQNVSRRLHALRRAVAFDPKHPSRT